MPRKQRVDFDEILFGDVFAAKGEELQIVAVLAEELA
jgi:hypothetical protein